MYIQYFCMKDGSGFGFTGSPVGVTAIGWRYGCLEQSEG